MRNSTLGILIGLMFISGGNILANEMLLKGIYQGKDLYIINPMSDVGEEYCAYEVTINGTKFEDVINSSAFRIYLDHTGLEFGQQYTVAIKHHENCTPKLVNPEVLKPLSTYTLVSTDLGYDNFLKFTTDKESGKLTFFVEEFRWGKWLEIGRVYGEGGPGKREYSIKVRPFSGENKYRIYQMDHLNRKYFSDDIIYNLEREKVIIITPLSKVRKEIVFNLPTSYVVINEFGEELVSGNGDVVDVSNLKKGAYFLNYENEYIVFKKK